MPACRASRSPVPFSSRSPCLRNGDAAVSFSLPSLPRLQRTSSDQIRRVVTRPRAPPERGEERCPRRPSFPRSFPAPPRPPRVRSPARLRALPRRDADASKPAPRLALASPSRCRPPSAFVPFAPRARGSCGAPRRWPRLARRSRDLGHIPRLSYRSAICGSTRPRWIATGRTMTSWFWARVLWKAWSQRASAKREGTRQGSEAWATGASAGGRVRGGRVGAPADAARECGARRGQRYRRMTARTQRLGLSQSFRLPVRLAGSAAGDLPPTPPPLRREALGPPHVLPSRSPFRLAAPPRGTARACCSWILCRATATRG